MDGFYGYFFADLQSHAYTAFVCSFRALLIWRALLGVDKDDDDIDEYDDDDDADDDDDDGDDDDDDAEL